MSVGPNNEPGSSEEKNRSMSKLIFDHGSYIKSAALVGWPVVYMPRQPQSRVKVFALKKDPRYNHLMGLVRQ